MSTKLWAVPIDKHALAHPVSGHRKIWAMVRHDGHVVSEATVLRRLRDRGLILPNLAARRLPGLRAKVAVWSRRSERSTS